MKRISLELTRAEKDNLLLWFENISHDQMRHGNGAVMFPAEQMLQHKLQGSSNDFLDSEIDLMKDWMRRNIQPKYGSRPVLVGNELSLYEKLSQLESKSAF